jgi:S-DNA-T family DNA segregation ATPase FtsK/SpoIIIE
MATRAASAPKRSSPGGPAWLLRLRLVSALALRVAARVAAGGAVALIGVALVLALLSYSPADPSFNTATARPVGNWMGSIGAHFADLLLQLAGWPVLLLSPALVLAGWRVGREEPVPVRRMAGGSLAGVLLLAFAAGGFGFAAMGAPAASRAESVKLLPTAASLPVPLKRVPPSGHVLTCGFDSHEKVKVPSAAAEMSMVAPGR